MKDYNPIKNKVEKMAKVTTRPMFGFQCFSIEKKFFVGFSRKNNYQIIVRLPKDQQEIAIKSKAIQPFSHGAKMGWIEIDAKLTTSDSAMNWISRGYEHAKDLAKK
jgi:TfoX/Sxy family transcriptional regulator of competence genes